MKPSYSPPELSKFITDNLIGLPYVDEEIPSLPVTDPSQGFNCWGFVRYMIHHAHGVLLPLDAFEAIKHLKQINEPEAGGIITFRPRGLVEWIHGGYLEHYNLVVHSSKELEGVARTYLDSFINLPIKFYKLR